MKKDIDNLCGRCGKLVERDSQITEDDLGYIAGQTSWLTMVCYDCLTLEEKDFLEIRFQHDDFMSETRVLFR